jgi:hypothetical protein
MGEEASREASPQRQQGIPLLALRAGEGTYAAAEAI